MIVLDRHRAPGYLSERPAERLDALVAAGHVGRSRRYAVAVAYVGYSPNAAPRPVELAETDYYDDEPSARAGFARRVRGLPPGHAAVLVDTDPETV